MCLSIQSSAQKDFVLALLRQVDIPETMKTISEVHQATFGMYQGWEEIALFIGNLPGVDVAEEHIEEIRVWRRELSARQYSTIGKRSVFEGPDFLIQRQGRPLERISLVELQGLITSAWEVWVDGQSANADALQKILDCRNQDCPFVRSLVEHKEAA